MSPAHLLRSTAAPAAHRCLNFIHTSHILSIRVSDFPEGAVVQQADQPNTQLAIRNILG